MTVFGSSFMCANVLFVYPMTYRFTEPKCYTLGRKEKLDLEFGSSLSVMCSICLGSRLEDMFMFLLYCCAGHILLFPKIIPSPYWFHKTLQSSICTE